MVDCPLRCIGFEGAHPHGDDPSEVSVRLTADVFLARLSCPVSVFACRGLYIEIYCHRVSG